MARKRRHIDTTANVTANVAKAPSAIEDADAVQDRHGRPVDREDADPSGGEQSGDLQGLPDDADADSQSIRELVADGQAFEAAVISGIEDAPLADEGEVRTREVPEDDVPDEYRDQQQDSPKE